MIIKQATDEDARIILELQKFAYQSEAKRYNDYTLPPLIQTFEEIQDDFKKQIVLKAIINDVIIGSVRAYMLDNACLIGRLIVHPDYQSQGIGIKLMCRIEDLFGNAKRFELFTGHESKEALRLYNKLGYHPFKSKKLSTHTLIYLEKHA